LSLNRNCTKKPLQIEIGGVCEFKWFFGQIFGTLQKVGQSLMMPVSVLPAADYWSRSVDFSKIKNNNIVDLIGKYF